MAKQPNRKMQELRRQRTEINKAIRELKNEDKVQAELQRWEQMDELKQKFARELSHHGMTLKKLMKMPDFYHYAEANGTRKARDKGAPWVIEAVKKGASEAAMAKRAEILREKHARKQVAPKRRKKSTTAKPATATGSGKAEAAKQHGTG